MSESAASSLTKAQQDALNEIIKIISAFKILDGKVIATSEVFGDTLPENPVEGQIFFLLEE